MKIINHPIYIQQKLNDLSPEQFGFIYLDLNLR